MLNSRRFSLMALASLAMGLGLTIVALAQTGATPAVSGQSAKSTRRRINPITRYSLQG